MDIKQNLDWDSDFFGFAIARLMLHPYLEVLHQLHTQTQIELAYFSSKQPINLAENPYFEIKLVDEKTVFLKGNLIQKMLPDNVVTYGSTIANEELLSLAVASGIYSRFNVDEKIGNDKFKKLYQIWIERSVKGEIAEKVLIFKIEQVIAGFITLGEKNNRADIGIIAVDRNFRGKGIGKNLMRAAENWAFENHYNELQVVTQGQNKEAGGLYGSSGFNIDNVEYFYHLWRK